MNNDHSIMADMFNLTVAYEEACEKFDILSPGLNLSTLNWLKKEYTSHIRNPLEINQTLKECVLLYDELNSKLGKYT